MRIACLGDGPEELHLGISLKLLGPQHDVTVIERNMAGDTLGCGVVFSDQTLGNLRAYDPVSAETIGAEFAHWDDRNRCWRYCQRSTDYGFIGVGRKRQLAILQERTRGPGVKLLSETE